MSYGKKKLESFKKRLETRQQELRRTVTRTQQDGRTADEDTAQDIADRAASSYTKEFLFTRATTTASCCRWSMAPGAHPRRQLRRMHHCGKEINPKRLEAVPWTRHCIECQEKLERACSKKLRGRGRFRCDVAPPIPAAFVFSVYVPD